MSDGPFIVTVEGIPDLVNSWNAAANNLDRDSALATSVAASEGVAAMQAKHPYTDRTGNLSFSMRPDPGAGSSVDVDGSTVFESEIAIEADYASFVDRGTVHAKPYPFTPRGEAQAERSLTQEERLAVERFERSCVRG